MPFTIEITPEVETRFREEAARRGQDVNAFVNALLTELVRTNGQSFHETTTPREWARAFREWAASHETTAPPIPLEALRREHLYEDRGA